MSTLLLALALLQDPVDLKKALSREILGPQKSMEEIQDFIEPRVPTVPEAKSADEWQRVAAELRKRVLQDVFFRGEAKKWSEGPTKIEWAGEIPGGPGYSIRKLRYEAVPDLWIPALLYVPEKLSGKVPVHMAVNGHDPLGKAADYKQIRCINLAKRGVISLNVEWFGMGQLKTPAYSHSLMNQLDLCGTAGLSPFYLSMKRGLDVLLSLENADPARVAVSGLSGGSWQTITISALDTRVTLTNPVAGYSSFKTRVRHLKDLGDSEQTPSDLATVADYCHFTAMMAPRPTLLTFNAKDNCCFESNYALQPLLDAAQPLFRLHGVESNLRAHVNHDPGTHNYGLDNRQAFYRMIGDHFFRDDPSYDGREITSDKEVKKPEELAVELPKDNATFTSIARGLATSLPRPGGDAGRLRELLRPKDYKAVAGTTFRDGGATGWKLMMGKDFTVPAVEIAPAEPKSTVLIFSENGRASLAAQVQKHLEAGRRVVAIDPFYFGESKIASHAWLFAITAAAVGERPLGIQASEIAAAARWAEAEFKQPVTVAAVGPRSSVVALCAAALEPKAVAGLELHQPMDSLKELIEKNVNVDKMPELFCFGLLREFDMKELVALAAPRPVAITK
ncbi:MAG TPA: hypothetical protein VNM14_17240 [Planctomycetota bacterium]|nr:hypothetical protein [Planctomycetota bacterium]